MRPGLPGADELPLAADLEVALGELEAVGRGDHRLEPLECRLRELVAVARHEEAVRLLRAPPDAAAQLMELREAEPVGLLDDHDRRVGDVDPHLDHGRRHQHVELAARERSHGRSALRRLQPAVDAPDAIPAELVRPEPLGLVLGRAGERRLRALDERADHVRLTAVVEVPAETVVRLAAALLRHPGRDDRLPVRRRRGDLRDREVAVDGQRERPRDRGRGHVEDVRAPPLREGGALLDAEAMLLVDHGHREVGELDLALDERVRADGDAHVTRRDELVSRTALARGEARRQEGDTDTELGAQTLDGQEVLLGERLRRRHQRALTAAFDRTEQRVERDRRLARPDVPLEQALHGRRQREVGVDLDDRVLLGSREVNGSASR